MIVVLFVARAQGRRHVVRSADNASAAASSRPAPILRDPSALPHPGNPIPQRYFVAIRLSPRSCMTCCRSDQASPFAGGFRSRYAG